MTKKLSALLFFFLIASGVFAKTCEVPANEPAVAPVPKHSKDWQSKHQQQKLDAAQMNAGLVLIGDSMIERWPSDILTAAFNGTAVLNLGIGGDRTQHVLWRLRDLDLSRQNPAHVVLMVGTNNLSRTDSACAISTGIRKIAAAVRQTWPNTKILLIGILPRGENLAYRKEDIGQINLSLKSLKNAQTIFIDPAGILDSADTTGKFIPDHLHLNRRGYQDLTELVQKHLLDSPPSIR